MNYSVPPVMYNTATMYNAKMPKTAIHSADTYTSQFFQRYLWQDLIGVLKWTLPEEWSYDYFTYCLYMYGFIAVFNTDKFGVICQQCGLQGYNIFYEPTHAVISSPLLKGILNPRIGTQCAVIRVNADWGGMWDLITYYADLMTLACESMGMNLINSRLSYILYAGNKNQADTLKSVFERIISGEPAVCVDNVMYNDAMKGLAVQPFVGNVAHNFIADKLLEVLHNIENMFLTQIGIPNSNDQKKERMIVDEVNSNNTATAIGTLTRLERMQKGAKQAADMFGINISVDWRIPPELNGGGGDVSNQSERYDEPKPPSSRRF